MHIEEENTQLERMDITSMAMKQIIPLQNHTHQCVKFWKQERIKTENISTVNTSKQDHDFWNGVKREGRELAYMIMKTADTI